MKEKHLDLCRDSVNSVFFQFLIPSIGATLVNSIYILGDTILVGRGVGSMGFAASGVFSVFCHRNAVWSRWKRFVFL